MVVCCGSSCSGGGLGDWGDGGREEEGSAMVDYGSIGYMRWELQSQGIFGSSE